jgi:hypothetical protein
MSDTNKKIILRNNKTDAFLVSIDRSGGKSKEEET